MDLQKKLTDIIKQSVANIMGNMAEQTSLGEIVNGLKENLDNLGIVLIETLCKEIDDVYYAQRPKGVQIRHKERERTLMTEFGQVRLKRRLYKNTNEQRTFFAVDDYLKIPSYTRVEPTLQSKLIEKATKVSYGEASRSIGEKLSRQTVFNIVKKSKVEDFSSKKKKKEEFGRKNISKIFIEADEDHIHLQNGECAEVKLAYIHEGRENVGGRTKLINPRYFVSVKQDCSLIWENVSKYVYHTYEMKNAEIHLSGDGANWIKVGLDFLPRAKFHLDKFHVVKSITTACGGRHYEKAEIIDAIKRKDFRGVEENYRKLIEQRVTRSDKRSTFQSFRYIDNNFDEISLSNDFLCSAEGHISHVLSSRMSSRPMGWSLNGAERIANLRAFMYNGGDFSTLAPKREKKNKQMIEIKKCVRSICYPKRKESGIITGRVVGIDGITNGTSTILRAILSGKKLF